VAPLAAPHATARQVAAAIPRGGSACVLTGGQFSLLDIVQALVEQCPGGARVRLSTWTAGLKDADAALFLLRSGEIRSFELFLDRSFPTRQPEYAAALTKRFGVQALRYSEVHAKVAIIEGGGRHFAVRSSMNLNRNPRFEQADISDDPRLAGWLGAWFDRLSSLAPTGPSFTNAESRAAYERALDGMDLPEILQASLVRAGVEEGAAARQVDGLALRASPTATSPSAPLTVEPIGARVDPGSAGWWLAEVVRLEAARAQCSASGSAFSLLSTGIRSAAEQYRLALDREPKPQARTAADMPAEEYRAALQKAAAEMTLAELDIFAGERLAREGYTIEVDADDATLRLVRVGG